MATVYYDTVTSNTGHDFNGCTIVTCTSNVSYSVTVTSSTVIDSGYVVEYNNDDPGYWQLPLSVPRVNPREGLKRKPCINFSRQIDPQRFRQVRSGLRGK